MVPYKRQSALTLVVGLAAMTVILLVLSVPRTRGAPSLMDSHDPRSRIALQDDKEIALVVSSIETQLAADWSEQSEEEGAEACTIAVATGDATTDGRPVLWKNRDYFGRSDAWQSSLFWHQATGHIFSPSDTFGDRFGYVAVSDRGDRSDPQDEVETLYYPRMGANEKGLGLVQAQAHTLSSAVQSDTIGIPSQDPNGIRNGGLNHWLLSRCETIADVEQLLTETNDGGGYNGSTARDTASLIAVTDRFGGAAIFEVDGNSFARQNITHTFELTTARPHSAGPPLGGYTGLDFRSNFSRINFTNTTICSDTLCFPYSPDVCTETVSGDLVLHNCQGAPDGVNDLEESTSSVKRWGRVEARMDDYLVDDQAIIDHEYFIQKWVRKEVHPREFYLETIARSAGNAHYLTSRVDGDGNTTHNWKQEKPTGWHLNRFVTVSSAVIVGSKAGDQDEGKLTTMWVALGEPSVAIFVPVFPYAGQPPAVLDDFFLALNAKRRLVYDYEVDDQGYPIDSIHSTSRYNGWRNFDHALDLSALFGGNYYGEGGLQAYNFVIEEELYEAYKAQMDDWRELAAEQIMPAMLSAWQEEKAVWATGEYVKSDPTVATYEAEVDCSATTGEVVQLDEYDDGEQVDEWAWQLSASGYLSCAHPFAASAIIEVIAKGIADTGQWPKMRVSVGEECLTEVGGETNSDCSIEVNPSNATNKGKDVGSDIVDPNQPRYALYRYRTTSTGAAVLKVEAIDATPSKTLRIDKVIVRTEPRSAEMYEVEVDWDAKSDTHVELGEDTILLTDPEGYLDIHHYVWGTPLTVEIVARGYEGSPTDPNPIIKLYGNSQLIGTAILTPIETYTAYSFGWEPSFAGQAVFRIQTGNFKDVRVDKLLVKETLPVDLNTAPSGYCALVSAANDSPRTVAATAVVADPDGDNIASYFWDFGDGESYCSGNPVTTHTYSVAETVPVTLYATDHRGKTAVIPCKYRVYLPAITKFFP